MIKIMILGETRDWELSCPTPSESFLLEKKVAFPKCLGEDLENRQ